MRGMTKSAVKVARETLAVGRRSFPAYGSQTSRHGFTRRSSLHCWCCAGFSVPTNVDW
jgi:hypothetical protein